MTTSKTIDDAAVFNVARRIDAPEARAEYLGQICGADQALRARVDELLDAYFKQPSFMGSPAARVDATLDATPLEKAGAQIGPYSASSVQRWVYARPSARRTWRTSRPRCTSNRNSR